MIYKDIYNVTFKLKKNNLYVRIKKWPNFLFKDDI